MDRTSEHARWLASSVSCCLPWSQERPQHELEAPSKLCADITGVAQLIAVAFDAQLCTTQPRRITPLSVSSETSQIPSQRLSTIPRQLSHASHRTSIFTATKRRTTRRPTISGPFAAVAASAEPAPSAHFNSASTYPGMSSLHYLSLTTCGMKRTRLRVYRSQLQS